MRVWKSSWARLVAGAAAGYSMATRDFTIGVVLATGGWVVALSTAM
jgi:hypothetical protein